MEKSHEFEALAQTLVSEATQHGCPEDPGATIANAGEGSAPGSKGLAHDLARLREVLDLPDDVLATLDHLDGPVTIDALLKDLFDRDLLDQSQFLTAHTSLDLDVGASELAPGERFRKLGFFDAGGAGEIFVAKDLSLRRKVAVKQLKPKQAASASSWQRFHREAQITAQLDHPNIVPIYSLECSEQEQAPPAYAMKLIRGVTLATLIRDQRERCRAGAPDAAAALRARLEILVKVCDAVDFAHSRRVIHRDLKPQNIMIGGFGEVYVMDWGLAHLLGDEAEGGQLAGTPLYMSPEQARARAEALAPASDIYALGLIFFELCTLETAIPGDGLLQVACNAVEGKTKPFVHCSGASLSPDLQAIFATATHLDAAARYPSAKALAEDIRRYLHGEALRVRPDNWVRKMARWLVRHRQLTLLLLLALVASLAAVIIWSLYSRQAALEAAKTREERIMQWQAEVAWRASDVDRQLLRLSLLTQRLGRSLKTTLSYPSAVSGEAFAQGDLDTPGSAPADYLDLPAHGRRASFLEPVYAVAPEVNLAQVQVTLDALYPLRETFQGIFLDYCGGSGAHQGGPSLQTLRENLLPLRWAYVALANGLFISYPGTSGLPQAYDARQRPWYTEALQGKGELVWGTPYYGVHDGMLGLPALKAVYGDDGRVLGVVGVEVEVGRLIALMLQRTASANVALSILDAQGRVLTSSGLQAAATHDSARTDALVLQPYAYPEIIAALRHRPSGFVEIKRGKTWRFIGYEALPTLGWFYVEEIPGQQLLGH